MKRNKSRQRILTSIIILIAMSSLSAVEGKGKAQEPLHETAAYKLYADRIEEGDAVAHAYRKREWLGVKNARGEMVRPFLRQPMAKLETEVPMLNSLYHIALADFEMNKVGNHFRVSPDFHYDMFFTRDIAYSSLLGANYAFADHIKSHLRECRKLRREVGFTTAEGQEIPIASVREIEMVEPLDNLEFFQKYRTHPYSRRTDDICWVLGYWEAMKVDKSPGELEWLVEEFTYFDETFYHHFLDTEDGLYHGQASFIDVGGTGYPEHFSLGDCILVKALSTNAAYYGAFRIIEEAFRLLGNEEAADEMAARAEALGAAIRKEFLLDEGHYAYFKHMDGSLEPRREQLGSAFLVWFDILEKEAFGQAVGNYPGNAYGEPLLLPFLPGERVYHNNSIWPFANTLFNYAEFKHDGSDATLMKTFGHLSRHALQGNFAEILDYETGGGQVKHARSYTWSAAAFMSLVYRFIFGLEVEDFATLHVHPHVPEALGKQMELKALVVQGTTIDIHLKGTGKHVQRVLLNGEPVDTSSVPLDGGQHSLQLYLSHNP